MVVLTEQPITEIKGTLYCPNCQRHVDEQAFRANLQWAERGIQDWCWQCRFPGRHTYHKRRSYNAETREWIQEVLMQDPCSFCNAPGQSPDHIDAHTFSGENTWENLTSSCDNCNSQKGSKFLLEFLLDEPLAVEMRKACFSYRDHS